MIQIPDEFVACVMREHPEMSEEQATEVAFELSAIVSAEVFLAERDLTKDAEATDSGVWSGDCIRLSVSTKELGPIWVQVDLSTPWPYKCDLCGEEKLND